MKVLYCGYRDWAKEILEYLECMFLAVKFELVQSKEEFATKNPNDYDVLLFVGWSWIIKDECIKTNKCVCMHPSPLPKYRGGSPLQHQIMAGETRSAATLFIMDDGVDTGPILFTEWFSLEGNFDDVLKELVSACETVILRFLRAYISVGKMPAAFPQDESRATSFKRRKESQSEITADEISRSTALQLHNKIRSLQDPYPNAFITCGDGSKLFLLNSRL